MSEGEINATDIPTDIIREDDGSGEKFLKHQLALKGFRDKVERKYIIEVLKYEEGNISKTAKALDIDRTYLHKKSLSLELKNLTILYKLNSSC